MAFFQVLYWQEIPTQIKTWDDADEFKIDLGPRFAEKIDATAQARGLTSTDDYLAQWRWSDEEERSGSAQEVADSLKAEFEARFLK